MASLSEKISLLTNPAPKVLDPEDDENIDAANINKRIDDNEETLFERSELRSRSAVLLDDYKEYGGKKVSRKSLSKFFHDDERALPKQDSEYLSSEVDKDLDCDQTKLHADDNEGEEEDEDEEEEEEEEDDDDDDDDDEEHSSWDLETFETSNKKQSLPRDEENSESAESEDSEESDISEDESNEDLTNKFSNIDVTNDMEKGAAIKAQTELWNRLCEARIKLQKLLIMSNKLPQSDCWSILKKNFDKDMLQCLAKGNNYVKFLANSCLDLEAEVKKKISEINDSNNSQETEPQSGEEIPSDSEEENQEDQKEKNQETVKKTLKRKLKCDEYGEMFAKRHKSLLPYRNSVIQKWDDRTKLSSGRITQKSFSTFESSTLKQIEQILQDESRIIKRTQLKRSLYRILGKPDDSDIKSKENTEKKESTSKQDMLLRDYDTEIFDDDDFYRQLLKDIIESKSVGIDPVVLRKQMEIQSVRNKIKKKVDTKASKGRKIRFDVHPKLVGFMKKMETTTLPDNARDNLLKCMFGKGYIGL